MLLQSAQETGIHTKAAGLVSDALVSNCPKLRSWIHSSFTGAGGRSGYCCCPCPSDTVMNTLCPLTAVNHSFPKVETIHLKFTDSFSTLVGH